MSNRCECIENGKINQEKLNYGEVPSRRGRIVFRSEDMNAVKGLLWHHLTRHGEECKRKRERESEGGKLVLKSVGRGFIGQNNILCY